MHKRFDGRAQCNDIKVASAGCLIFVAARPNLASHPTQCQLHTRLEPLFISRLDSSTEAQQQIILKSPSSIIVLQKTISGILYSEAEQLMSLTKKIMSRGEMRCGQIKKPLLNFIPFPLDVLDIWQHSPQKFIYIRLAIAHSTVGLNGGNLNKQSLHAYWFQFF